MVWKLCNYLRSVVNQRDRFHTRFWSSLAA